MRLLFPVPCVLVLALLLVCGCSGNRRTTARTDTGTTEGSLYNVTILPAPGSAFISKGTRFRLSWSAERLPPPSFEAVLMRYREARGEEVREIVAQRTELERRGDSYEWELGRADNFTLDEGGVYYVQLRSGAEEVLATYIVSNERSITEPTAAEEETGAPGELRHKVVVFPGT